MQIKSVVIIGSGTMGSGIAAHLCNANIPVTLLDLSTDISTKARERIYKSKPPLLIDKKKIELDTGSKIKGSTTLKELLKRPNFHYSDLIKYNLNERNLDSSIQEGVEIDIKYEGYLKRQKNNIEQINRQSCKSLPQEINYEKIETLSLEARENLNKIKPKNFGDASKIPGVSKADLTALLVWLKIREIKKEKADIFVEKKLSS